MNDTHVGKQTEAPTTTKMRETLANDNDNDEKQRDVSKKEDKVEQTEDSRKEEEKKRDTENKKKWEYIMKNMGKKNEKRKRETHKHTDKSKPEHSIMNLTPKQTKLTHKPTFKRKANQKLITAGISNSKNILCYFSVVNTKFKGGAEGTPNMLRESVISKKFKINSHLDTEKIQPGPSLYKPCDSL